MENEKLRRILKKILKQLGLKINSEQEFYKPDDLEENICNKMKKIVDVLSNEVKDINVKDQVKENEKFDELQKELGGLGTKKEDFNPDGINLNKNEFKTINDKNKDKILKKREPEQKSKDNKNNYDKNDSNDKNIIGDKDAFEKIMQGIGTEFYSEKRNRLRTQVGPPRPVEPTEKEKEEQEKMEEYFEEYNRVNHGNKSLLEMHQEKKKENVSLKRQEFNTRSLGYSVVDSKKVFETMKNSETSLGNKFSSARFKKSFM